VVIDGGKCWVDNRVLDGHGLMNHRGVDYSRVNDSGVKTKWFRMNWRGVMRSGCSWMLNFV
jgi:hypothetical protein